MNCRALRWDGHKRVDQRRALFYPAVRVNLDATYLNYAVLLTARPCCFYVDSYERALDRKKCC
jgi:hypothetical protein